MNKVAHAKFTAFKHANVRTNVFIEVRNKLKSAL